MVFEKPAGFFGLPWVFEKPTGFFGLPLVFEKYKKSYCDLARAIENRDKEN